MNENEIIQKYKDLVYRIAFTYCKNHIDTDDVFQDVFLRYFRKNPEFKSDEHEKAWFIRVTINSSKNFLTSSWRKNNVPLDESIIFEDKDTLNLFEEIKRLSSKYSIVIFLYYYEGYKIMEISKLLKISESSVKQRLSRARKKLKIELTKENKGGIFDGKTGYTESI